MVMIKNLDNKLLWLLAISALMPFPITAIMIIAIACYVLVTKKWLAMIKKSFSNQLLIAVSLICFFEAILRQNYLGIIISIFIAFLMLDVIYFKAFITKETFNQIIESLILISLVSVVLAIFQQIQLVEQVKQMHSFFDIQNKPQYRVSSFYFNANYFAMMIVFVENLCIYAFMKTKDIKKRVYYTVVGLTNLFALYLTGGRIGWLALLISGLVMLVINGWYKLTAIISVFGVSSILVLLKNPHIIPRFASHGFKVERRHEIWNNAILMVKDHPLFGYGPLGYFTNWYKYLDEYKAVYGYEGLRQYVTLGTNSQHAHTIFLEPLISFGLLGCFVFILYFIQLFKNLIRLFKRNEKLLVSLISGLLVSALVFCLIDFPILWIQTGLLWLLLINSCELGKE